MLLSLASAECNPWYVLPKDEKVVPVADGVLIIHNAVP